MSSTSAIDQLNPSTLRYAESVRAFLNNPSIVEATVGFRRGGVTRLLASNERDAWLQARMAKQRGFDVQVAKSTEGTWEVTVNNAQ